MFGKKQLKLGIIKRLGGALIFLIMVLGANYILSGRIVKISHDATENRTAITILENKGRVAEELGNNFIAIGDGDKKIGEAFIEAGDIAKFIDKLESIAKTNKLEQDLRFGTPIPLKAATTTDESAKALNLTKVDYTIELQGDVTSINKYLKELEKVPYFSSTTSITIVSLSTATNWKKVASASIEAQLYLKQ